MEAVGKGREGEGRGCEVRETKAREGREGRRGLRGMLR